MEVFKKKISETKKHALMRRLYDEAQLVLVKMNEVQTLCIRLDEGTGTPADEYDWASLLLATTSLAVGATVKHWRSFVVILTMQL